MYCINNYNFYFLCVIELKEYSDSYSDPKNQKTLVGNDLKENCNCTAQPEKKQSKIKNEQQRQIMIAFEDNLQNIVYVKTYVEVQFLIYF